MELIRVKLLLFLSIFGLLRSTLAYPDDSFVVSSTESFKDSNDKETGDSNVASTQITDMDINTNVTNRFAKTLITSKVKNPALVAKEATFTVILPDSAYISKFVMEIGGKSYEAYVKEKEEAKQIYDNAVASGMSAAHVAVNARDSNRFTVSVNVEPESKAIFYLTYEELLQRKGGQYEVVINVHPGHVVKHLNLQVNINETRPLKFVRTPALRSGNEIAKNNSDLVPNANIETINETSAVVSFSPEIDQQMSFAEKLGKEKEDGIAGQFIVQYDVDRDTQGGEILINDGYFVHFFAPSDLRPLKKQVVFVLDMSGSMGGLKMNKLKGAMEAILTDLKPEDVFSIIAFDDTIRVFDIKNSSMKEFEGSSEVPLKTRLQEAKLPVSTPASQENKDIAKELLKQIDATGLTNIMGGLEAGIFLVQSLKKSEEKYSPMIIFLTDGEANVGISDSDGIINEVQKLTSDKKIPTYSLSFGDGADREFLKKLSLKNLGFARHIYDAADADIQLQDFYKEISSPLLTDVKFEYVDNQVKEITKTDFPHFFNGGELVVAGRYVDVDIMDPGFAPLVCGIGLDGPVRLPPVKERPLGNLERLWAYLTIKQKLEESKVADNKTVLEKEALDIALKYSFVTPVSSLVVVKPNDTSSVNTVDASKSNAAYGAATHYNLRPRGGVVSLRTGAASYNSRGFSGGSFGPRVGVTGNQGYALPPRSSFSSGVVGVTSIQGYALPPPPRPRGGVVSLRKGAVSYNSRGFSGGSFGPRVGVTGNQGYALSPPPRPQYNRIPMRGIFYQTDRPVHTTAFTTMTTVSPLEDLKTKLPWLENILGANNTLTIKGDTYKLGLDQDNIQHQNCANAPSNNPGQCTLLHECPTIYSLIDDEKKYEDHFCALNEFAGVCCPTA